MGLLYPLPACNSQLGKQSSDRLNLKKFFPVLCVAAGERYPNKMLRPSLEDYWGAGSILATLEGEKTIEALLYK